MPRKSWARRNLPTFSAAAEWVADTTRGMFSTGISAATAFAGAVHSRLTADWVLAPLTSADEELRADARTLRARARELARNNPLIGRFLGLLEENVVGPTGIMLQARVVGSDGEQNTGVNKKIEAAWKEWGKPKNCTVDGRLSWADVQELAIRTVAQDGEFLARKVEGYRGNPFGFALQVLDADQLDHDFNRAARGDQNEVRMGVEPDGWGRPVAYHLFRSHPKDMWRRSREQQDRIRVPASQVIHMYVGRRPGQTRGVTWLTSVMRDAHNLDGLQEAEIVASRMAAATSVIFEYTDATAANIPDPNLGGGKGVPQRVNWGMEPGSASTAPMGMKAHLLDPQHPNTAFEPFTKTIQRSIATGLRSSYHSISGDLSEANYSSMRDGTGRERDVYERLQRFMVEHLLEEVYSRWLLWALTTGRIDLPTRNPRDWDAHEWQPRGFRSPDPLKDALTLEKEIELGINSRTRGAAERGRDYEQLMVERAREEKIAEDLGVPVGGAPGAMDARKIADMSDEEYERYGPEALAIALAARNGNGNGRTHAHR